MSAADDPPDPPRVDLPAARASADALRRIGRVVKVLAWLTGAAGLAVGVLALVASDGHLVVPLIIGMMLGTVILFALAEVTSGLGHALALLREAALAQAQADRMRMFDRSRT